MISFLENMITIFLKFFTHLYLIYKIYEFNLINKTYEFMLYKCIYMHAWAVIRDDKEVELNLSS